MEYNIENEEGILIQGKGNYCSKLKKGKLKTKKLLKITRYIRWTRALSTISRASLKLRKYVFIKTWKWSSQHLYLKINSGFHARKDPKQQYLKVVTYSDPSSSTKHIYVYDHAAWITHWTDHPVHEKVLKLGLFVSGVTHISNLTTVCVKLMRVGGWV